MMTSELDKIQRHDTTGNESIHRFSECNIRIETGRYFNRLSLIRYYGLCREAEL